MKIAPLKKQIYEKLKALNVDELVLHFSGGSDEGYLDVELISAENRLDGNVYREIEDWAWEVYSYSGAGEGSSYGDDIVYDIKNKKVSHSEWYTTRSEGSSYENALKVE
jgi:hypothetical protein